MIDQPAPLSAAGEKRRADILQDVVLQADRRRLRRKLRVICSSATAAVVAATLMMSMFSRESSAPTPTWPMATTASPSRRPPAVSKYVIERAAAHTRSFDSDPTAIERLSVRSNSQRWVSISDNELLAILARAGHRPGLLYYNGKAVLIIDDTPG